MRTEPDAAGTDFSAASSNPTVRTAHPSSLTPARRRRRILIGGLVTLVAAVFAVAATTWAPLRRQVMLSVSQSPASYTEMYFTDFAALPHTVRAGVPYQVGFTLVAHGHQPSGEQVAVTLEASGQARTLGSQLVAIGSKGEGQAVVTVEFPQPKTVYTLVISLPSGQAIQWRVPSS